WLIDTRTAQLQLVPQEVEEVHRLRLRIAGDDHDPAADRSEPRHRERGGRRTRYLEHDVRDTVYRVDGVRSHRLETQVLGEPDASRVHLGDEDLRALGARDERDEQPDRAGADHDGGLAGLELGTAHVVAGAG